MASKAETTSLDPEVGASESDQPGRNSVLDQKEGHADESWETDENNPYNWTTKRKTIQVAFISMAALTSSIGTSIISPAVPQLREEFGVSTTVALLPTSLFVWALALGPAVGGPLSETIGRYPVYLLSTPLAALFTLGAGFSHSIAALSVLRFLAGLCFSPIVAISAGTINDTFLPISKAIPSAVFILMPFLGPAIGPVIGAFLVNRKGWRWTQWTLIFFSVATILLTFFGEETHHPIIQKRLAKKRGQPVPPTPPLKARLGAFLTIALLRPLRMLFLEPIVSLICLYVAVEFATLFSFFAAVPYVYALTYRFTLEQQGLVFTSIAVGCLLGAVTVMACNAALYMPRARYYAVENKITPPELRLYPAMIGSFGLPVSLFWFGWTARPDISWASPTMALVVFAWGNICIFVSMIAYMVDIYTKLVVASGASANGMARYGLGGALPLVTIQMYQNLGIDWASSLLGFVGIALLPVPFAFFKWGRTLRAKSIYETIEA